MAAVPGTARAAARDGMRADLLIEDVQNLSSNPTRLRIKIANAGHAPAVESRLKVVLGDHGGRQLASRVVVAPLLKAGERQWLVVELDVRLAEVRKVAVEIDEADARSLAGKGADDLGADPGRTAGDEHAGVFQARIDGKRVCRTSGHQRAKCIV